MCAITITDKKAGYGHIFAGAIKGSQDLFVTPGMVKTQWELVSAGESEGKLGMLLAPKPEQVWCYDRCVPGEGEGEGKNTCETRTEWLGLGKAEAKGCANPVKVSSTADNNKGGNGKGTPNGGDPNGAKTPDPNTPKAPNSNEVDGGGCCSGEEKKDKEAGTAGADNGAGQKAAGAPAAPTSLMQFDTGGPTQLLRSSDSNLLASDSNLDSNDGYSMVLPVLMILTMVALMWLLMRKKLQN